MKDPQITIQHAREDADGWEAAAAPLQGRVHFNYMGVARMLRETADVAEQALLRATKAEQELAGHDAAIDR